MASATAAMNLTYKILGRKTDDLLDILRDLAAELGSTHIFVCPPGAQQELRQRIWVKLNRLGKSP
ncbi:MAG TPA: hypothetical protein VGG77_06950 [Roseiarcus sp.]